MYFNFSVADLGAVFGGYDEAIVSKLTEAQQLELAQARSMVEQNAGTARDWNAEWNAVRNEPKYAEVLSKILSQRTATPAAAETPESLVRRAGLEVHETSYDGSCGFEALVQQLPAREDGKRWTRQELRGLLVQLLRDAAQKADVAEAKRLRERATVVARNDEWMRDDDVPCLANYFGVDVIMVYADPSNHQVVAQRVLGSQRGCDYDVEPIVQAEGLDLAESLRENAKIPGWDGRMPLIIINSGNSHWLGSAQRAQSVD